MKKYYVTLQKLFLEYLLFFVDVTKVSEKNVYEFTFNSGCNLTRLELIVFNRVATPVYISTEIHLKYRLPKCEQRLTFTKTKVEFYTTVFNRYSNTFD